MNQQNRVNIGTVVVDLSQSVVAAARKQNPEAIFFQETHNAWAELLSDAFLPTMPLSLWQYDLILAVPIRSTDMNSISFAYSAAYSNDRDWAGGIGFVSAWPSTEVALIPSPIGFVSKTLPLLT